MGFLRGFLILCSGGNVHLYFLMVDGRYIHKSSNLQDMKIKLIHSMKDCVYYDNIAAAKGLNTRMHNKGIKSYICQARVELENIFGESL